MAHVGGYMACRGLVEKKKRDIFSEFCQKVPRKVIFYTLVSPTFLSPVLRDKNAIKMLFFHP